jgi:hypothetical protein
MINSQNYLLIIVPYLTLCCGLYELTYWMLFSINAFNVITIQDIVTSSISPLILSFITSSIGFYFASKLYRKKGYFTNEDTLKTGKKENRFVLSMFLFIILIGLLVSIIFFIPGDNYKAYAMIGGMILYIFTDINFIFAKDFNPKLDKRFLLMVMIYFPLICIAEAFADGDKIINNKAYKFAIISQNTETTKTSDTLKLVGISNEKFIFTNLKNEIIYFIKSDTIILYRK